MVGRYLLDASIAVGAVFLAVGFYRIAIMGRYVTSNRWRWRLVILGMAMILLGATARALVGGF